MHLQSQTKGGGKASKVPNFFPFTMPPVQENAKQQQDYGGLE